MSVAFVREIYLWPVDFPQRVSDMEMFLFDDIIMVHIWIKQKSEFGNYLVATRDLFQ